MSSKKCPNCRLWNDEIAIRCDCGYDFKTGETETRNLKSLGSKEAKKKDIPNDKVPYGTFLFAVFIITIIIALGFLFLIVEVLRAMM